MIVLDCLSFKRLKTPKFQINKISSTGDFTNFNGYGGESIYGEKFAVSICFLSHARSSDDCDSFLTYE